MVSIDNQKVMESRSTSATVHKSRESELALGYHAIEIVLESNQPRGQMQLYWRGPGFQWEPVTERYLVHPADKHPSDDFERGRLLARGLRCAACHQTDKSSLVSSPLQSPN